MPKGYRYNQIFLEHPALVEFYDVWECGTEAEINERFESIWRIYSNERWGDKNTKEKIRQWIISHFVC